MPSCYQELRRSLALFTPAERRDMLIYILGLMVFKYATEAFNGTMVALATVQYDKQAALSGDESNTFQKIGLLQGLNLGMRCLGSILVGPLLARYPTRSVLGGACVLLGVSTASLLVLDAVTGGQFKHGGDEIIGNYNPDALIPIHAICGISNGMADLVRAVIPSDMVGGHVEKLQKLDSLVHIFFNIASVCGSITTAMYLIPLLGHNRAFVVTPICCCVCAIFFCCVSNMGFERLKQKTEDGEDGKEKNIFWELGEGFVLFARSIYAGGRILLTSRDLCWLIPCYGVGSYAHRYLDTGVLPKLASRYLGYSSWSMIMCTGSSIGELLGSLLIFFFTKHFRTPIFWLRIDAFFMFALWIVPFWTPKPNDIKQAWIAMAYMIPLSLG